jgi:hypothetical protein
MKSSESNCVAQLQRYTVQSTLPMQARAKMFQETRVNNEKDDVPQLKPQRQLGLRLESNNKKDAVPQLQPQRQLGLRLESHRNAG